MELVRVSPHFLTTSWSVLGPTQPPILSVPGLFVSGIAAGTWCNTSQTSTEVEERVQLYLHFTSGPSWSVPLGKPYPPRHKSPYHSSNGSLQRLLPPSPEILTFSHWSTYRVFTHLQHSTPMTLCQEIKPVTSRLLSFRSCRGRNVRSGNS